MLNQKKPEKNVGSNLRVEIFSRTYVPEAIQKDIDAKIERIEDLSETEDIEVRTIEWSKELRNSKKDVKHEFSDFALQKFEEFKKWSDETGYDIHPFFEEHDMGRSKMLTFPILSMAVYHDNDLLYLVPCSGSGGETYTVEDGIEILESEKSIEETEIY